MTKLAIDIGNTNITLGIFCGKKLVRKTKIATAEHSLYVKRLRRFLRGKMIDSVIVSSVVPMALVRFAAAIKRVTPAPVSVVGRDTMAPIRNLYRKPSQVGQDRLVNAFAAKTLYGAPAIVIDFGTAITFDIVSRRGEYLGGLILPGIGISLSSLHEKTALLPRVELKATAHIIGKDTAASMRGGILFGFGAMCDGLVARYKKILGSTTKVIATGGNARLVKRYSKSIQIIDEDLTLKGLNLIKI